MGEARGHGSYSTRRTVTPSGARSSNVRDVEEILSRLRAAGGRVTATRRATVEALLADPGRHIGAEDIVAHVRARLPEAAESTVYRTLGTLEELGVITHTHLGHGPATFHLAGVAHRHLVCRHCHTIIEIPAYLYEELAEELERLYGFRVSTEHFAITGQCRGCRSEERGPSSEYGNPAGS